MSVTTQTRFAEALSDTRLPVPTGLAAWNGPRPQRRFEVYRNNVISGLTGALASRFPSAERVVGEEFFAAMARRFIELHPPHSPLLLSYGDEFPDFVEGFEPASALAYLPDLMRLEAARGRAYHAADAAPLATDALASVDPDRLAELTFVTHPAATVLRSAHPVVTIWAMNTGQMEIGPITGLAGEDTLVVRPHMTVEVHPLPPGGAIFLQELHAGVQLADAVEAAAAASEFDLAANLAGALRAGAFTAIRQPRTGAQR